MAAKVSKKLTREQATELYKDLQKNLAAMKLKRAAGKAGQSTATMSSEKKAVAAEIAASIREAMKRDDAARPESSNRIEVAGEAPLPSSRSLFRAMSGLRTEEGTPRGAHTALALVIFLALAKVVLSALESSGIATVDSVDASMHSAPMQMAQTLPQAERAQSVLGGEVMSREEIRILTALDTRRAELEDRSKRLDAREHDLDGRDRALAEKLTQLRELTERLKIERDRDERKRSSQLDQLANVYGSMNPPEAAQLLEQLDTAIALSLIERMPEKRIGQILALMNPEKALMMTKMLSGKARG